MNTAQEPLTSSLPQKGYPQDALFAGDKVPPFPFFIENPGESHLRDELSPVNRVEPARETSPEPLPDRCQFFFSDGRQCRMPRSEIHPSLCRFHAEREDQLFGDPAPGGNVVGAALDLPELHSACRDLTTTTGVNRALAQVFRLLAQRRISRQEAATFGHLAQLLLRSISAMRVLAGESPAANVYHLPQKGHPPRRNVYQQDELSPQHKDALFAGDKDELRGVDKDHQELSPVNKVAPFAGNKTVPSPPSTDESRDLPVSQPVNKNESERGAGCAPRMPSWRMAPDSSPHAQAAPAPNSQGPQNEHLRKLRLQPEQNEQFQKFET
jgi:Fe-S-cluster containining protein